MDKPSLADNLKRKRKERGVNQTWLANAVGINKSYMSELESGKKTGPTPNLVARLAKSLNCTPADLWDEAEGFAQQVYELARQVDPDEREAVLKMLTGMAKAA